MITITAPSSHGPPVTGSAGSGASSSAGVGAIVLVAHGSRDPAAAVATRSLARVVAAARPGVEVRTAYLDHTPPRPATVLAALAGDGRSAAAAAAAAVVVVPLLLTAAYHSRVDLPAVLAEASEAGCSLPVVVADVLGPVGGQVPWQLLAGLRRRLREAERTQARRREAWGWQARRCRAPLPMEPAADPAGGYDAVVLAAAGTRDAAGRRSVSRTAVALGAALGVPCRVGYASAAAPTPGEAVAQLRAAGARRVAMAGYFLAPGRLYRAASAGARAAGAALVAEPLGAADELAELVLARAAAASGVTSARGVAGNRRTA